MALRHRGFLLDASGFKERISPILISLDAGNARPLYEQAVTVVEQTPPDQWPLRLAGSNLLDIRKVNLVGSPWTEPIEKHLENISAIHSYDIGYWLLLIFSIFLRRCPGMGYNYSILDGVLSMLGWSQRNRKLLFEGTSTTLLLKPDAVPVSKVSRTDPYWHCMRPANSYAEGWLSQEQISDLYQRLLAEEDTIQTFDHRRFGNHWGAYSISVPDGQLDYLKRLHAAYERAIMMFEAARQAGTELYMAISYE